jgi:glycosyltransferase involved in cell wall biosynthesis
MQMTVLPRVVFLSDIPTPYMIAVLRALAHQVDLTVVFCAQRGSRGADWAFDAELGFRHRVLGGLRLGRGSDAADRYPTPRILGALIAERPAAVISGAFSFPTMSAAVYSAATGVPFIIHSDGTAYSERGLGHAQRAARRWLVPRTAACVGNSVPAMERFIELGAPPERVFSAPHATDIAPFQAVAARRAGRHDGPLIVLHVGRLIPRKGVDRLLRAAAAAAAEASLRVVLVGSGPEEPALRRLARELRLDVEFRGFVDQPDLPAVYAEADVFTFPTLDDPFGIVVLEAAASGLPLVASPFGGATPDVVRDGVNGFVVDPRDTGAWARALAALAHDPALRTRLGAAARAAVRDRTPERAADGYAAAVAAVLKPAGTQSAA